MDLRVSRRIRLKSVWVSGCRGGSGPRLFLKLYHGFGDPRHLDEECKGPRLDPPTRTNLFDHAVWINVGDHDADLADHPLTTDRRRRESGANHVRHADNECKCDAAEASE